MVGVRGAGVGRRQSPRLEDRVTTGGRWRRSTRRWAHVLNKSDLRSNGYPNLFETVLGLISEFVWCLFSNIPEAGSKHIVRHRCTLSSKAVCLIYNILSGMCSKAVGGGWGTWRWD